MEPLRTHDVVLAEGTFRIVMTPKRRVIAVLDASSTALGPLHIVLAVDRGPYLAPGVSPRVLLYPPRTVEMAGFFDDAFKVVSHAAEGAFNAASHAITSLARPAFDVVKAASSEAVKVLAHTVPFLPQKTRKGMDAAARTLMRAKLGDVSAKQFIKGIEDAAKAGGQAAQMVGAKLLDASKVIAHVADLPVLALQHIPGVGPFVKSLSPLQTWDHMATAIEHGDFKKLGEIAKQQLSTAEGVVSLVPGIGTGISSALSAGMAALEGGNPIEIAIRAAYGAIPIPPGLHDVTDIVLDSVLQLTLHGANLTDVAIHVARDRVPSGFARDVFDTLIHLVVQKQPIQRAAGDLVDHFVKQYAPAGVGLDVSKALANATMHVPGIFEALPQVAAAAGLHGHPASAPPHPGPAPCATCAHAAAHQAAVQAPHPAAVVQALHPAAVQAFGERMVQPLHPPRQANT